MYYLLRPLERRVRRHLTSEINRQRFDRAKRFVDEAQKRDAGNETALRVRARWLKFLCSRPSVQEEMWPKDVDILRQFATAFGVPSAERRKFVGLSLLGRLWRIWFLEDLSQWPRELVARLTRVTGWEYFERCRQDGTGLILLPVHSKFSYLIAPYLRHRGHAGVAVGSTNDGLEGRGFRTPAAKRFELARQMHAAKQLLARGGLVYNLPDSRQNLDNSRTVEFFGQKRALAAGFAELVLKTGAHVVPIAYRFSARGFFVVEFGAPFHVLGEESTHDERVDSLVAQYANFLRDEWRRYPWNIPLDELQHYCRPPEIDRDAPNERASALRPSEARLGGVDEEFAR
jgi:lauroyl/myristoyl acyltransferase